MKLPEKAKKNKKRGKKRERRREERKAKENCIARQSFENDGVVPSSPAQKIHGPRNERKGNRRRKGERDAAAGSQQAERRPKRRPQIN